MTIYNGFVLTPHRATVKRLGRRSGVAPDEPLLVHPVRAIERKNVPAAWSGPSRRGTRTGYPGGAEEGYGPYLEGLLAAAGCRVIHRAWTGRSDLYAAADAVLSRDVEGFGNPPVEAALTVGNKGCR